MINFVHRDDFQASLGDREMLNWHRAREKDFAAKMISRECIVRAVPSTDALEARRGQVVADLFVNFPHNTVEEALATLATPSKKADLSWISNVRHVIPQLQEQMPVCVKQDSGRALSQHASAHSLQPAFIEPVVPASITGVTDLAATQ
jgi:hypothetical protein